MNLFGVEFLENVESSSTFHETVSQYKLEKFYENETFYRATTWALENVYIHKLLSVNSKYYSKYCQ